MLYLVLFALLSVGVGVGVGMIVRDTAGAITTMLAVLYLAPLAAALVSGPVWRERLHQISPTIAGQAVQATIGLEQQPIGPWAGLGALAAYAGAARFLGGVLFTTRDA